MFYKFYKWEVKKKEEFKPKIVGKRQSKLHSAVWKKNYVFFYLISKQKN